MQILLLCDNSSNERQSALIPDIIRHLSEAGHDISLALLKDGAAVRGAMCRLTAPRLVAVAGDDDTLNEAVNGLMANPKKKEITTVFFPTGENNFLAREFGIESVADALEAVRQQQACLFRPTKLISPFDKHYFSDFLSIGLSGLVHYVATRKLNKKGFFFYLLKRIFKNPPFFEIIADGVAYRAEMAVVETGRRSILPNSLRPRIESKFDLPLEENDHRPFSVFIYEKESWFSMYKNLFKICFKPESPLENTLEIRASRLEIKELEFKSDKKTFSIETDGNRIPTSSLKISPSDGEIKVLCCLRGQIVGNQH